MSVSLVRDWALVIEYPLILCIGAYACSFMILLVVIWFNRYVVVGGMQGDTLHPLNDSIS